jgi:hypothetical protein
MPAKRTLSVVASTLILTALSACAHIGPKAIVTDRFDYNDAVSTSWKQQTLLNVVRLRNGDFPVFVDVSSIVSGYSLETNLSLDGSIDTDVSGSVGAGARFTDRPTVTYTPLTGQKFVRGIIAPIDPKNIFFLLQAGYPADFILGFCVDSINGVRNRAVNRQGIRPADPGFLHALDLLAELQSVGAVGIRIEEQANQTLPHAEIFLRSDGISPEFMEKLHEFQRILKLDPKLDRYSLIYSPVYGDPDQFAVKSRSIYQIMSWVSTFVDAVEAHGNAREMSSSTTPNAPRNNLRIHSGTQRADHAFVQVKYRDRWYWIDDDDYETKATLSAIVLLFSLADTGENARLPLVTIPAQ